MINRCGYIINLNQKPTKMHTFLCIDEKGKRCAIQLPEQTYQAIKNASKRATKGEPIEWHKNTKGEICAHPRKERIKATINILIQHIPGLFTFE